MLTYWFDEERGSTFCLADAPAEEKVRQLHAEAHGSIPHKIMEVNPETVKAFLGRIEDPQPPAGFNPVTDHLQVDSAFRAIMFTDIVGYTALMGSDEDQAFEVLRKNREIHIKLIREFNGTLIKEMGDGTMAQFNTAVDAVNCAVEIQRNAKKAFEAPCFV